MTGTAQQIISGSLIAALISSATWGGYYFTMGSGAPENITVDNETLCRTDQPLQAHRIVLVDTTDVLRSPQQKELRRIIDQQARNAEPFERLSIFSIDATNPYEPKQLFSACAPKNAKDAKGISENPKLFGAIWARQFGTPLDAAIKQEMLAGSQSKSPLIESMFALSLQDNFSADIPLRRLIILSDMLQNSIGLSLYQNSPRYSKYQNTQHGQLHIPDFRGVEITVRYIIRPEWLPLQVNSARNFWHGFFMAGGASPDIRGIPQAF